MSLHWRDDAACRMEDARLFDPINAVESKTERTERVSAAQKFCGRCPVRERCFAEALEHGDSGVFAGVLLNDGEPVERSERAVLPCGTDAARKRHRYNREAACIDCEAAHVRRLAQRRRERSEREYPCGTPAAARRHYRNGESACEACLAANRRKKERAERRLTPCGSHAAYVRHKRHGEPIDVACRRAENEYKVPRNRARRQRAS